MLKVLFAASECTPMVKVGGLGDVIGSVPKALKKAGVDPAVILPRYEIVDTKGLRRVLRDFEVEFRGTIEKVNLYQGFLPNTKIPIFYIENDRYLSKGGPVYFSRTAVAEGDEEFQRFHFFSHAVYALLQKSALKWEPDVVHCNDWHTGFLVKLLKSRKGQLSLVNGQMSPPKAVFTIHNLGNQGVYKDRNPMAEGIVHADRVTTVSPSYAKEIRTKEYGAGLERILKKVKPVGILNGIDYATLKSKFDKKKAKLRLQKELGFAVGDTYPLFGLVSRLVDQKGIHLIPSIVERFADRAQFVFLGVGDKGYEGVLAARAKKYPRAVSAHILFSEELAREIYIASDFFLMPSMFEPCGLGQMIAMHYGTIPVVRATGGLKDTVREGDTGFVFARPDADDFSRAITRALRTFEDKSKVKKMRARCRAQEFSWTQSAKEYITLYDDLIS